MCIGGWKNLRFIYIRRLLKRIEIIGEFVVLLKMNPVESSFAKKWSSLFLKMCDAVLLPSLAF